MKLTERFIATLTKYNFDTAIVSHKKEYEYYPSIDELKELVIECYILDGNPQFRTEIKIDKIYKVNI